MTRGALRTITVDERRARLARRHRVAPGHRAADVVEATESVVALHATDPSTVFLSAWARIEDFAVRDLEAALYADRTLVKHLAMRRTLWVFPRAGLPAAVAGPSARVAAAERKRLIADVEKEGLHTDGARWLDHACAQVMAALSDGREVTSTQLRDELGVLEGSITQGAGKSWGAQVPVGPRVLTVLSAQGHVVRATNDGGWTASRPTWSSMDTWVGSTLEVPSAEEGTAALVERWLRAFGPGTVADLKWWMKSTVAAVRQALAEVGAVEVALDDGALDGDAVGYVLADDVEPVEPVEPWVALLPPLDPTTMGWTERGWYLGDHKAAVFDTNGNAGPTAWVDGRIVGGWRQRDDASVELQLLEDVGATATAALQERTDVLTEWLDGVKVAPRFPSPLSKQS